MRLLVSITQTKNLTLGALVSDLKAAKLSLAFTSVSRKFSVTVRFCDGGLQVLHSGAWSRPRQSGFGCVTWCRNRGTRFSAISIIAVAPRGQCLFDVFNQTLQRGPAAMTPCAYPSGLERLEHAMQNDTT